MKRRLFLGACVAATVSLVGATAVADDAKAPEPFALVELFTSEG